MSKKTIRPQNKVPTKKIVRLVPEDMAEVEPRRAQSTALGALTAAKHRRDQRCIFNQMVKMEMRKLRRPMYSRARCTDAQIATIAPGR